MGSPPRPESNKPEVKVKREVGTPPGSDSNKRDLTTKNILHVRETLYLYREKGSKSKLSLRAARASFLKGNIVSL